MYYLIAAGRTLSYSEFKSLVKSGRSPRSRSAIR
jgi:hypothetical protein